MASIHKRESSKNIRIFKADVIIENSKKRQTQVKIFDLNLDLSNLDDLRKVISENDLDHERHKLNKWIKEWKKNAENNRLAYLKVKNIEEVIRDFADLLKIENIMSPGDFKNLPTDKQQMIANIWQIWDAEIRPLISNKSAKNWGMRLEDSKEILKR